MTKTTQLLERARPVIDGLGARLGAARAAGRAAGAAGARYVAASPKAMRFLQPVVGAGRSLGGSSSAVRGGRSGLGGLGWGLAASVLLSWWLGTRYGWTELRVIAGVGFFLLLGAVAFVVGRSRYAVRLDLAHRRVVVGERVLGRVEVTNTSTRALLPAEVELPVGAGLAAFPLPRLAAGEAHEDVFAVPTQRRCVIIVGPVRSVRGDPLGIARRETRWTDPIEVFVHPRTVALTGVSAGFLKDLEGRPTRDLSPSDVSFHALREYVVGDDRRHVHWKTTARTGHLMVRQFEETRRSHLAVALSTDKADYADPEEFELAVSVAGSLGLHAFREEKDLTVVVQGGPLRRESATRLLDDLTRVVLGSQRGDVVQLAQKLGEDAPDASVVVLIFGSAVTPAQMRAAAVRIPQEVRTLAVRCVPGTALSRRSIGDLTVLSIGDLKDLPLAMRRVAG